MAVMMIKVGMGARRSKDWVCVGDLRCCPLLRRRARPLHTTRPVSLEANLYACDNPISYFDPSGDRSIWSAAPAVPKGGDW